jgi:hypothetical protein
LYQRLPSWTLGFHGTDQETVDKVLNDHRGHLNSSANEHDWLGGGIYFWENDPVRALKFSRERMKWKGITDKKPAVIGAIIDLGLCLNLFDQPALMELKEAYDEFKKDFDSLGIPLPVNGKDAKLWSRDLDCAVIEHVHGLRKMGSLPKYDTVRSAFQEGKHVYLGTEFRLKNHIQIAVRESSCIKGYFLPRSPK